MKEKLYPVHVALLIYILQTGVTLFSLPRLLAQHIGYNGWASLFIFSAIAIANILLIGLLHRVGKGKSIFVIIEQSLPKFIAFPLYSILIALWSLIGCLVMKQYVIIFQVFAFPGVHPMFIKALADFLAYALVIKGIYILSKAATNFFFVLFWLLLLLLFFVKEFHFINLTTFVFKDSSDLLMGGLGIYSAFLGYELSILLFPYAEKKGFVKAVITGNLLSTLTYLSVSFVSFGFYSIGQLRRIQFPIFDLLAYIQLPFIERIESLVFAIFLLSALIILSMYMWAAIEASRRIIPKANRKKYIALLFLIAYIVSWIPDTLHEVTRALRLLSFMEMGVAFGLPLFLLLLIIIQKGVKGRA